MALLDDIRAAVLSAWLTDPADHVEVGGSKPVDHLGQLSNLAEGVARGVIVAPGSGGDHAAQSNLAWTASGHTGTAGQLAAFGPGGAAAYQDPAAFAAASHNHSGVYSPVGHDHSGVYQPLDDELTALAGLTSAANAIPYFTGSGAAAVLTPAASRLVGRGSSGNLAALTVGTGLEFGASALNLSTSQSFTTLTVTGTTNSTGLIVDDYIAHNESGFNTWIRFQNDRIDFAAGGVNLLTLVEGASDSVIVNPDEENVNFVVNYDGGAAINVNGSTGAVTFGNASGTRTGLGALQQIAVKKASNSTLANTSLASMGMSSTIGAGEWYQFALCILCNINSADDLKFRIAATGTVDVSFIATDFYGGSRFTHNADLGIATNGTVDLFVYVGMVRGGGSGGTLDIQAAKNADTGADGTFYNDSNYVLTRIA